MLIESQGKLEKSQRKVREFRVKNLADTLPSITKSLAYIECRRKKGQTSRHCSFGSINSSLHYAQHRRGLTDFMSLSMLIRKTIMIIFWYL